VIHVFRVICAEASAKATDQDIGEMVAAYERHLQSCCQLDDLLRGVISRVNVDLDCLVAA
jgi:hypothetical protein